MYEKAKPGTIADRKKAKQLITFENLVYARDCAPTDFDIVFDCYGMGWIVGEVKHKGTPVRKGQLIALERFVSNMTAAGIPAYALILEHEVDDPEKDVSAWKCMVRKVRKPNDKHWRVPNTVMNCKEAMEYIFTLIDSGETWKERA